MNQLYAGFARVNVTPMLGIGLRGYFEVRQADGVLDDLEINALALACGKTRAILLSMDICAINQEVANAYRAHISEVTGIPADAVYIHATHTHTGPYLEKDSEKPLVPEYYRFVYHRMADAAALALQDLKPARMGWAVTEAPGIAFMRRYRMKDGSFRTNPGRKNPDIDGPIGQVDERVSVLRFDREEGDCLLLANFGNHPDVIGGCKISADWPGHFRRELERILPGSKCIFFNGAQGDVNHINVNLGRDEFNGGYEYSRHMGRVLAGAVLQVFDKVNYVDVDSIRCKQDVVRIPSNMPDPEEMPEARRVYELYMSGRKDELAAQNGKKPMSIAQANRMLILEHGPEIYEMRVSAVAIGDVVLIGIPGEAFTGIGRALKDTEGWELILPTCLTNGGEGYFPMKDAFEGDGYERNASRFKAGVAELFIEAGKQLLNEVSERS